MDRSLLMEEARMQTAALKRLARWAGFSAAFSASGIVLLYYMFRSFLYKLNYSWLFS